MVSSKFIKTMSMCIAIDYVSRLAEGDILFCSKIYISMIGQFQFDKDDDIAIDFVSRLTKGDVYM